MVRYITTLERLGKDVTWLILQQARGIPEAKVIECAVKPRPSGLGI